MNKEMNNKEQNKQLTIKVLDAMMGSGKSTVMQEFINNSLVTKPDTKFIYLTPFLTEVERFKLKVPKGNFVDPSNKGKGKVRDFMSLVHKGENISSTHACFKGLSHSDIEDIKDAGYILVVDEAIEAICRMDEYKPDLIADLISSKTISVSEKGQVKWNHISKPRRMLETGLYINLYNMCESSSVYLSMNRLFVNEFPIEVMKAFKEVVIMTYIFEGSIMSAWADIHEAKVVNITSKMKLPFSDAELKERAKKLIKLYEPRKELDVNPTQNWYRNAESSDLEELKKSASSFCKYIAKSDGIKAGDILVTCPKDNWKKENPNSTAVNLAGQGYSRATWLASNARATNDYAEKKAVMYMLAKHCNPYIEQHIRARGGAMCKDTYALAEMLQFIWRGCIRKPDVDAQGNAVDNSMHLYIPNSRMKKLFKEWLNS